MVYANDNILATILHNNDSKIEQLQKVADFTWKCTSDTGIEVTCEVMEQGIIRYTIEGTRSGFRFCYSSKEKKIIRQPRGLKRMQIFEPKSWHTYADDVLALIKERKEIA